MYTLKSTARRSSAFGAAVSMLVAAILPAGIALADQLNPLTERSLLLSSSAPGFQDTDGSGNSNGAPNSIGENYAPAGSGPNGKKSGETFSFKVSSTTAIKGFSLQYCTTAAGLCRAPGNNTGSSLTTNRELNSAAWPNQRSDFNITSGFTEGAGAGNFQIFVDGVAQTGWSFATSNVEDSTYSTGINTGTNNYVKLMNASGGTISNGQVVKIVFRASESIYITNPGDDAFFVKLNTYNSATSTDLVANSPANVDGGVTVANVMTDSIHITTKVLETMAFSVGTRNPDTQAVTHGTCDEMEQVNDNRLNLGNPDAEYSLETGKAWDVNSYWRLSSNSSGGATVYYSGNTLQNTVGDYIADMPTEAVSKPGTEQFGLGFVDAGLDTMDSGFTTNVTNDPTRYRVPRSFPFKTLSTQTAAPYDTLASQPMSTDYDEATGTIDDGNRGQGTAKFKFLKSSLTVPEPIAQENDQVISCATAKMRYVGNIGADTPAGVYTTKINYLAAPQY